MISVALFFILLALKFTDSNIILRIIFLSLAFIPLYALSGYDLIKQGPTTVIMLRLLSILLVQIVIFYLASVRKNQLRFTQIKPHFKYLVILVIPLIFIIGNVIMFKGPYPTLSFETSFTQALATYRSLFGITDPVQQSLVAALSNLPRLDFLFISIATRLCIYVLQGYWLW